MSYQRGIVRRIVVEIEYPDGSTKSREIENPETVDMIALSADHVRAEDRPGYSVSETDWRVNPAMAIYRSDSTMAWGCTQKEC